MPYTSYPISGVVKDSDNSTLLEGATVTAYNETNEEEISITSTTNSVGEYTLDLANLTTSGYADEDYIVLKVTYPDSDKIAQYRFQVDTDVGYEEKNLTVTYHDATGLLYDLLNDQWQIGNTDLKMPTISKIYDLKRVDVNLTDTQNYILIYSLPQLQRKNAIGSTSNQMLFPISIQILGSESRIVSFKIKNEVDRILNANIINPAYKWDILDPDGEWKDLCDRNRNYYKFVHTGMKFRKLNASRTEEWVTV